MCLYKKDTGAFFRVFVKFELKVKMKQLLTILFIGLMYLGYGQDFEVIDLNKNKVKGNYKGQLINAKSWKDSKGKNTLLVSLFKDEKAIKIGISAFLYKGCFQKKLIWKFEDFETMVDFDGDGAYSLNSIEITDLDKDGIAETTISFVKIGDATDCCYPNYLYVFMFEEDKRYAIRGTTVVLSADPNEGQLGGEKEMFGEDSFSSAPESFLTHASKIFDNMLENN